MDALILHEDLISANCYKIRLTARLLSVPLQRRSYDILKGETRTAEFINNVSQYGRIPVLQIDDSTFLPESNAACYYLASTAPTVSRSLIPADPLQHAQMLQWMFFEQNRHENNIAVLRFWLNVTGEANLSEAQRAQLPEKRRASREVMDYMNDHLGAVDGGWFVGGVPSLADVCLFAYTHVLNEAGFDVNEWPHVARWCEKITLLPEFEAM